jgi:type VI protein secretion system component Hcp
VPSHRITLSRVFRTAPARAALALGCAAAASSLLVLPATAASAPGNVTIIRPSHTAVITPSFIFPTGPTGFPVQSSTAGNGSAVPVSGKKSATPKTSSHAAGYVSTFSPAPIVTSAPATATAAACLANSRAVTGATGDLDLPGMAGASKDAGHVGALPITALGPTSMVPPQIDSADLTQLQITRTVDASSANLAMVASSGYRFPCIHIEIGAGQGYANVQYALVNAGLVADDRSGQTETLTWTYSTVLWSYSVPGSKTVHHGSGRINARPDKASGSLVDDSKAIALGTIGLTVLASLALIALYVAGSRRHRARYRARYYRRAVLRAERAERAARAEAQEDREEQVEQQEEQAIEEEQVAQEEQVVEEEQVVPEEQVVEEEQEVPEAQEVPEEEEVPEEQVAQAEQEVPEEDEEDEEDEVPEEEETPEEQAESQPAVPAKRSAT